jgi:hypothetical protein
MTRKEKTMKFTVDQIELTEEQAKTVAEQCAARPRPTKEERIGELGNMYTINCSDMRVSCWGDKIVRIESGGTCMFGANSLRGISDRLRHIADILDE